MHGNDNTPDALLFVTPGCPHCPVVLDGLGALVKEGVIGRLEVINVASHPERAAEMGVRTAPWTRIGPFELDGSRSAGELRAWAERAARDSGTAEYAREQLAVGRLEAVQDLIDERPERLRELLTLIADPESPMQVRLGVGAVFESLEGNQALKNLVPDLAQLSGHEDRRVRSDACHYLGLSHAPEAAAALRKRLNDDSEEVREIAAESLEGLEH